MYCCHHAQRKGEAMTDQEFVLSHYPSAELTQIFEEDDLEFDWAIVDPNSTDVFGWGDTITEAWADASLRIKITEKMMARRVLK